MYLENIMIKCRKCGSEDIKIKSLTSGGCGDSECCGEREYYGIKTICLKCNTISDIEYN